MCSSRLNQLLVNECSLDLFAVLIVQPLDVDDDEYLNIKESRFKARHLAALEHLIEQRYRTVLRLTYC